MSTAQDRGRLGDAQSNGGTRHHTAPDSLGDREPLRRTTAEPIWAARFPVWSGVGVTFGAWLRTTQALRGDHRRSYSRAAWQADLRVRGHRAEQEPTGSCAIGDTRLVSSLPARCRGGLRTHAGKAQLLTGLRSSREHSGLAVR
jgi:hypothetical protein